MGKIITILLRRGTSAAWERVNPTLKYGEPGFEKDTNRLKIGDGVRDWNNLPYFGGSFQIKTDGKSVALEDDTLKLYGYSDAQIGQIPHKSQEGLDWKDAPIAISDAELMDIFNQTEGE